jgi:protein required for attachment to host cells
MLIPHGTLVVIADSHAWRLLRNAGTEAVPVLVAQDTPALAEAHHAGGHGGAHATEAGHATAIGNWLASEATAHRLDHLVLIAPPRLLGELRNHLAPSVARIVRHTLAKDLIGRHEAEILAVLRGI